MTWRTTDPMNERVRFMILLDSGFYSVSELADRFGISRKTAYKWIRRYQADGAGAMADRPRSPRSCPHRMPDAIADLLIDCRKQHPTWGPRKLVAYLATRHSELRLPAYSTVGDLLKREGLVQSKRRRIKHVHPGKPTVIANEANDVWAADFKGEFKTRDGIYCYPLTVTDLYSRFLIGCVALTGTARIPTQQAFHMLFQIYGLPSKILTDNGTPFASAQAIGGLSKLAVYWMKLGIQPVRIEPGRPDQNGKHERMHKTLKAEATRPSKANLAEQQREFNRFRHEFNFLRPHDHLDLKTPASCYQVNARRELNTVPPASYPKHYILRKISGNSSFKWFSRVIFVSRTLEGEVVGIEEIEDGIFSIWYRDFLIGRFNERDERPRVL